MLPCEWDTPGIRFIRFIISIFFFFLYLAHLVCVSFAPHLFFSSTQEEL